MKIIVKSALLVFLINNVLHGDLLQDLSKHAETVKKQGLRLKKKVEDVVGKETVKSVEEKAKKEAGKIPGKVQSKVQEKFSGKKTLKTETPEEIQPTVETVDEQIQE